MRMMYGYGLLIKTVQWLESKGNFSFAFIFHIFGLKAQKCSLVINSRFEIERL